MPINKVAQPGSMSRHENQRNIFRKSWPGYGCFIYKRDIGFRSDMPVWRKVIDPGNQLKLVNPPTSPFEGSISHYRHRLARMIHSPPDVDRIGI